jgi:hypothetical protein
MTSHAGRLSAAATAILVLFLSWAVIAARPWASTRAAAPDPRLEALAARERRVRADSIAVDRIVRLRWRLYRQRLAARNRSLAAAVAPSVRVVTLPPLTITRTS